MHLRCIRLNLTSFGPLHGPLRSPAAGSLRDEIKLIMSRLNAPCDWSTPAEPEGWSRHSCHDQDHDPSPNPLPTGCSCNFDINQSQNRCKSAVISGQNKYKRWGLHVRRHMHIYERVPESVTIPYQPIESGLKRTDILANNRSWPKMCLHHSYNHISHAMMGCGHDGS